MEINPQVHDMYDKDSGHVRAIEDKAAHSTSSLVRGRARTASRYAGLRVAVGAVLVGAIVAAASPSPVGSGAAAAPGGIAIPATTQIVHGIARQDLDFDRYSRTLDRTRARLAAWIEAEPTL